MGMPYAWPIHMVPVTAITVHLGAQKLLIYPQKDMSQYTRMAEGSNPDCSKYSNLKKSRMSPSVSSLMNVEKTVGTQAFLVLVVGILIGNSVLPKLHNDVDPISEVSSTPLYLTLATGFPTAGGVSKLSILSDRSRLLFHEACLQSWTASCVTIWWAFANFLRTKPCVTRKQL